MVADYLITNVVEESSTRTLSLNYNDGSGLRRIDVQTYATRNLDAEHDMLLVPHDETPPPGGFSDGITATEYLDTKSKILETVSVVYQAEDDNSTVEPPLAPRVGFRLRCANQKYPPYLTVSTLA